MCTPRAARSISALVNRSLTAARRAGPSWVAVHALGLPQHSFKKRATKSAHRRQPLAVTFTISARPVIGDLVITTRPKLRIGTAAGT
ncbi:MAG TPA: hypothetical protein VF086_08965 [Propionibacteriaceae bacterium]